MIRKILLLIFIFLNFIGFTQNKKCNTTFLMNKLFEEDIRNQNLFYETAKKNNKWIEENVFNQKEIITIPIVVHVIHKNTHSNIGSGTNISNEQIEDAIRILNEDFSKTNSAFPNPPRNTFINLAADVQIQFCLATSDENGNPTTGVTRTSTTRSDFDPDTEANDMKRNSTGGKDGWDPEKYLNIWVCNLATSPGGGMTLGYSYLPGSLWPNQMWRDGLVVDFQYFGTVGATAGGNDGSTATHEIGHYLGLLHTFCEETDNNGNPTCCDNDDVWWGGNIDDTPATEGVYWGSVNSNTNNNTCNDLGYSNIFNTNVLDMDDNFMSYSSDVWMFTNKQSSVMNGTMNNYRSSLKNSPASVNCTGIVGNHNILNNNHIRVYPNPSKGKILIQNLSNSITENISIKNSLGNLVKVSENNNSLISIDLSNLENGIYFIEINSSIGKRIEKIILTK